jgi:hypothetical protein
MFRQYEDPFELQERLDFLQGELEWAKRVDYDEDYIIDLEMEIYELKDRINFAWQDIEYDEMYSEL